MAAKPARKPADPEPPTLAVPERPRSSDPRGQIPSHRNRGQSDRLPNPPAVFQTIRSLIPRPRSSDTQPKLADCYNGDALPLSYRSTRLPQSIVRDAER